MRPRHPFGCLIIVSLSVVLYDYGGLFAVAWTFIGLLVVLMLVSGFASFIWYSFLRPLFVKLGYTPRTASDFVIEGWKAEREGQWPAALAAYDEAITLSGWWHSDASQRRAELIENHPELAAEATRSEWIWLESRPALEALLHFNASYTRRRLRLLSIACCRMAWYLLTEHHRAVIEACDQQIETEPSTGEKLTIPEALNAENQSELYWRSVGEGDAIRDARAAVEFCADASAPLAGAMEVLRLTDPAVGKNAQIKLLVCILGSPSQPVGPTQEWRTSTVLAIAHQMYDSRDFNHMPVLADALEEAGCTSPTVLHHCRSDGPHARGCWVVDLLLGKK